MSMIDVYAAEGTFSDRHRLAQDLANAVMEWERVPSINLFRKTQLHLFTIFPLEQFQMLPATAITCVFRC